MQNLLTKQGPQGVYNTSKMKAADFGLNSSC